MTSSCAPRIRLARLARSAQARASGRSSSGASSEAARARVHAFNSPIPDASLVTRLKAPCVADPLSMTAAGVARCYSPLDAALVSGRMPSTAHGEDAALRGQKKTPVSLPVKDRTARQRERGRRGDRGEGECYHLQQRCNSATVPERMWYNVAERRHGQGQPAEVPPGHGRSSSLRHRRRGWAERASLVGGEPVGSANRSRWGPSGISSWPVNKTGLGGG